MTKEIKTTTTPPSVPDYLKGHVPTGAGVPTKSSDFLIPIAKVLDPKSPEVERRGPSYVKGAEPGDVLIKSGPIPLIKGEVGFLFQLCHIEEAAIEWLPRTRGGGGGGGFVARHPVEALRTAKQETAEGGKIVWINDRGNFLVHTRYYTGYMLAADAGPLAMVIPFASTGHTVAKGWNLLIANQVLNGHTADVWMVYYRLRTRLRTRADQAWYVFEVSNAGPDHPTYGTPTAMWAPTPADLARGQTLNREMEAGHRQPDPAAVTEEAPF
jgi:hypothetical protein